MKKLLCLLLALMMLCTVLPALAADNGLILAVDCHYANLKDMSAQFKGGESTEFGCLGLSPATNADGTFADAFMQFDVTVEEAGLYVVRVQYAAKAKDGQIRCADLIVNDGERIPLPITGQEDWNVYATAMVHVHLNAGQNKLVLKNVEGFDNEVYKSINVDYLRWGLLANSTDTGYTYAFQVAMLSEGLKDPEPQVKGGEGTTIGCMGLQPATLPDGAFADAKLVFLVDVVTGGAYDITVQYAAKAKEGQTRCADLIVNGGERIHLPITAQADWNVYVPATVQVELQPGLNRLVLTNVEGFDNETYKSINVDFLAWQLAE